MKIALTRPVGPALARCELTHLARAPIDVALAARQHAAYERLLADLGCAVRRLPAADDLPDAVFVEDVLVVLDGLAVVTRPGAASRRPETEGVEAAVAPWRPCTRLDAPATLDGGDVLAVGRTLYVGRSRRTNDAGIARLRALAAPLGYGVVPVPIDACLHLKSAVTRVGAGLLLLQRDWVDPAPFAGLQVVESDPDEPFAANALLVGDVAIHPAAFPRTRARLEAAGVTVAPIDVSELARAEGGVTCCSVVFDCPHATW